MHVKVHNIFLIIDFFKI